MTPFELLANEYYAVEASKLLYEPNGQRKLIFIPENIFEAFRNYKNISDDIKEDVKRAIVLGIGKAIEREMEQAVSAKISNLSHKKTGSQIFNGQLTDKRERLQLWVEVTVFYKINDTDIQFSFKHTFSSDSSFNEEFISKIQKSISRKIALPQ